MTLKAMVQESPWNQLKANKVKYGKLVKSDYIDILKQYSFNVPSIDERMQILDALIGEKEDYPKEVWLNKKQYVLGIFISTLRYSEVDIFAEKISKKLEQIYQYVLANNVAVKFLDYVLSADWGKAAAFFRFGQKKKWSELFQSEYYKKSDEFSCLILKLVCSEKDQTFLKDLGFNLELESFISLVDMVKGKTGGLLRNVYFSIRREKLLEPNNKFSDEISNLIQYIQVKNLDDITAYAVVMLAVRSLHFNQLELIEELMIVRPNLSKLVLTGFNYPYSIWSKMQLQLVNAKAHKYENIGFSARNLYDFYNDLLNMKITNKVVSQEGCVGVIITTYAPDLDLFKFSLRSILQQTYSKLKVCIVDDCNTNEISQNIAQIVADLADDRVLLIKNNSNVGQYISRNVAMEALADCSYFAIQDDDDISHPQRLEYQINALRTTDAQLVMCQQVRFSLGMRYIPDKVDPMMFDFGPASSCFKAELRTVIGGFANVRSRGDVEFIERIKGKYGEMAIGKLALPMYIMRCELETVSASKDRFLKTQLDVFRKLMSHDEKQEYFDGQQHALFV